ncbi:UDP-glucose 4-epimerase [archaeon BMS3Bbin15]|nr:UDP-glucose 4-epimerase [archaeon BMS3Bbin15]
MEILVTGGAGYIGSHAVKALAEAGYTPIVLDNLSQGHRESVRQGVFYQGELGDTALLKKIFTRHDIEAVMHFAALALIGESISEPAEYYENNVIQTFRFLKEMVKHDVKNFIFSSTCAVYGIPEEIPIPEEHLRAPVNPYGKTKLAVEYMLEDFSRAYNIKYVFLRYFNAAGADYRAGIGEDHSPETHLIPIVLDAAIGRRKKVNVFGTDYPTRDGTCIRDYIHVTDLAQAHVLAAKYLKEDRESGAFNLGVGQGFSVREVIDVAEEVTGKKISVSEAHRRKGDPPVLIADSTRAINVLRWKPEYSSLEDIISSAWEWHKRRFRCEVNQEKPYVH